MQINVTSKHINLTPAIEEYISSKTEKLTRFYDRIEQIDVKIEKVKHGFIAEIISHVEHHAPIISSCDDPNLHASIDGCVDRNVRQLTDLKTRLRDHKNNTPTGGQDR